MILLDMSKMIRLQQDLHEALVPLQKCDVLIENIKKNKGKYFYYKGNIYRDLDDIAGATYYYSKAFDELSYELALQEYFDGFVIVALYGNSRTNVELFGDLYSKKGSLNLSRKEKIMECLRRVSEPDKYRRKFRNSWNKKNINYDYKYFLDCLKKEK